MIDFLLQIGVNNLCLSLVLALAAFLVHRIGRLPFVAHLLWLLVLVKLITPPLITLPVIPVPGLGAGTAATMDGLSLEGMRVDVSPAFPDLLPAGAEGADAPLDAAPAGTARAASNDRLGSQVKLGVIVLWALGSVGVFAWSMSRIARFNRLLRAAAAPPSLAVERLTRDLGRRLGLKATPLVCTTTAQLSPMVWWLGGRPRIILPASMLREIEADELRLILAHELAHVKRRDHLVRWLEWLACVVCWWNPIAWWARRNLRINEEICCDALVLASLQPQPQLYAKALITVVEFLASPALRPPAVASEINSGGVLERRFRMIVSTHRITKTPRWLTVGAALLALCLLPLGVAYGQDFNAVGKRLREAVAAGELSTEQARTMMQALRGTSPQEEVDREALARERMEAVETELRALVEAGKITPERARERLAAVRQHMVDRLAKAEAERAQQQLERQFLAEAEARLKRLVDEGMITREEMVERVSVMRHRDSDFARERTDQRDDARAQAERQVQAEAEARLRRLVEAGMITEVEARERIASMRRPRTAREGEPRLTQAEYAAIAERLERLLEEGMISEAEASEELRALRGELADRLREGERGELHRRQSEPDSLADHYAELGVDRGRYDQIRRALAERGVTRDKHEAVLGSLLRLCHEMRAQGDGFELSAWWQGYFKGLGLTAEHVEVVTALARRLASSDAAAVNRSAIQVELRLLAVPESKLEELPFNTVAWQGGEAAVIGESAYHRFLRRIDAGSASTVITSPRLLVWAGEQATVQIGDSGGEDGRSGDSYTFEVLPRLTDAADGALALDLLFSHEQGEDSTWTWHDSDLRLTAGEVIVVRLQDRSDGAPGVLCITAAEARPDEARAR